MNTQQLKLPCQFVEVHVFTDVHLSGVDLHDSGSSFLGRSGKFNLSIETTGTKESGIENVDAVGGGNDLKKPDKTLFMFSSLVQCVSRI